MGPGVWVGRAQDEFRLHRDRGQMEQRQGVVGHGQGLSAPHRSPGQLHRVTYVRSRIKKSPLELEPPRRTRTRTSLRDFAHFALFVKRGYRPRLSGRWAERRGRPAWLRTTPPRLPPNTIAPATRTPRPRRLGRRDQPNQLSRHSWRLGRRPGAGLRTPTSPVPVPPRTQTTM